MSEAAPTGAMNEAATAEAINAGRAALDEAIARYKSPAAQEFELSWRRGQALAASTLIPKDYRGKPENCMIALEIAERVGMSPLLVMQNLYLVHGRPSWSAQFTIAAINRSPRFGYINYEFSGMGDDWQCVAWATEKATGERVNGPPCSVRMAKDEGWWGRKSRDGGAASKWPTMTENMLMYRSASFFGRMYVPEVLMGFPTVEESEDIGPRGAESGHARVSIDDILSGGAEVVSGAEAELGTDPATEPCEPDDGEERVIEGEVSNPVKFRVECLQCGAADLYTPGKSDCTRECGFTIWLDDNGHYVDEPEQGSLV